MATFNSLPNKKKADYYKLNYKDWKKAKIKDSGYFVIFDSFEKNYILKNISGNALKLYIFLGLHSKNFTGESWFTIESISNYFNKTPRTISYWIKELEEMNLIKRIQLELNKPAHTFLQPYSALNSSEKNESNEKEK